MTPSSSADLASKAPSRFAWVAAAFGLVLIGGFVLILWALENGEAPDPAASPYHLPLYVGLAALVVMCAWRAIGSQRRGTGWLHALPAGYGSLGLGAAVLVAALVLDLGWREGVGIWLGIENAFAPSRVLVAIGLALVAAAPLRAALIQPVAVPRPAVLLSAALMMVALGWPGGFHPATSPWMAIDPEIPPVPADVWVMDADGTDQTRIIEAGADQSLGYASWAPDGSRIAYTTFALPEIGIATSEASIWTAQADGGDASSLLPGAEWRWIPRFTPDGASVLFTQEAQGGPWMEEGPLGPGVAGGPAGPLAIPLPNADIWQAASDGHGDAVALTDSTGDDRAPVPSPDGTLVLFDSTRDGNTELYVMEADGSNPRRLTDDPSEDWGASWSPDGTQIAFNSFRTGAMEIFVMDADGTGVRQLTFDAADNVAPSWSPDGTRIAFTSRVDGRGQIWSMAVDGGDRVDLSRSPSSDDQVWTGGWGPDGQIIFTRRPAPIEAALPIVRLDLGTAAILVSMALLAAVVVLLARTRPLPGSYAAVLLVATTLLAAPIGEWRFVPAGLAAGVAADLAAWIAAPELRGRVAAGVAASAFVLGAGAVALATTGLEWTPTLLLGVALAVGVIGWALGALEASGHRRASVEPP